MTPLLDLVGLTVRFENRPSLLDRLAGKKPVELDAVANVSLNIGMGETYALVGESGSGKSTLARAINGLLSATPDSGILFEGRNIAALSPGMFRPYRRHMAMMFQDPIGSLSPRMTVGAQLVEPFIAYGEKDRDLDAECHRLLDMVGLPAQFAKRYPHELSGGQARRVGVARALALDPKLIIADEPTAGLDVSVQGEVLNLLNDLQDRTGLSILIITHNLHVVRHVAHRTGIMYLGRIVEEGPSPEIFDRPRHPYTKALLSAAPVPDPDAQPDRIALSGEFPSIAQRPQGCEFHTRCPLARDVCRSVAPEEIKQGRHRFACHFPLAEGERMAMAAHSG